MCRRLSVSQALLIQVGSVGILARGIAGNQAWTRDVTFPEPFGGVPTVALNAVESWFMATATNVTAEGFRYVVRNLDSTARLAEAIRSTWVAVGTAGRSAHPPRTMT